MYWGRNRPDKSLYLLQLFYLALPFGEACDTLATNDPDVEDEQQETRVYEKHDKLLHGERKEKKYVKGVCISLQQLNNPCLVNNLLLMGKTWFIKG